MTMTITQPFPTMSSRPKPSPHHIHTEKHIFYEFIKLSDDLVPTYSQVKELAVRYVKGINQDSYHFNWAGFKRALDNQETETFYVDGFITTLIPLQNMDASVFTMVGKVTELLPSLLPKAAVDQLKLKHELTPVLHELDELWEDKEDKQTTLPIERKLSREYRALVGVSFNEPNYLRCVAATVAVNGYFKKESRWWGFGKPKITKTLDANISVMDLVVNKGFTCS